MLHKIGKLTIKKHKITCIIQFCCYVVRQVVCLLLIKIIPIIFDKSYSITSIFHSHRWLQRLSHQLFASTVSGVTLVLMFLHHFVIILVFSRLFFFISLIVFIVLQYNVVIQDCIDRYFIRFYIIPLYITLYFDVTMHLYQKIYINDIHCIILSKSEGHFFLIFFFI